jgi:hypothetical protein
MTAVTANQPVVYFPKEYISRVRAATDNVSLCEALAHRNLKEADHLFTFVIMHRPHHDNAERLLRIRKLYDEYKELCKGTTI